MTAAELLVFAGPSAAGIPVEYRDRLTMRPPAARGDLDALLALPPGRVLLLDGLFGQQLAVSVLECVRLLRAGWQVWGASSIGALRAAETWSVGMIGIGDIYAMLRSNLIVADDELAVAYHPEGFRELTVSVVQVRAVLARLVSGGTLTRQRALHLLAVARDIYWYERRWAQVRTAWCDAGMSEAQADLAAELIADPQVHPKLRDAATAVRAASAAFWPGDHPQPATPVACLDSTAS